MISLEMSRSVSAEISGVAARLLTRMKNLSENTNFPAFDPQTRETNGQKPEEQLLADPAGTDTEALPSLSQSNSESRRERISTSDQVKVLNECIKWRSLFLDSKGSAKGDAYFWESVHRGLGEGLQDRFDYSSKVRNGVNRWVKKYRTQLTRGQLEPLQGQRDKLTEALHQWYLIWGNKHCLANIDIIEACIWAPSKGRVGKLIAQRVHAEVKDQLRRFESEVHAEWSENALAEESHSRPNLTQRISNMAQEWDGMHPRHLVKGEALRRLIDMFKPDIEKVVVDNMEDRILDSSRDLSNWRRSVFSSQSVPGPDTEWESESGSAAGRAPSPSEDTQAVRSTNRRMTGIDMSVEKPLQSIEPDIPSPSRIPSSPMLLETDDSCPVDWPGEGRRIRRSGPWLFSETETDAMSQTQSPSPSPSKKRETPHDEAGDASRLAASKKQKHHGADHPGPMAPSISIQVEQTRDRHQIVTEREHARDIGPSAGSPTAIDHLPDVESCSSEDVATSDQALYRVEKHNDHRGKGSEPSREPLRQPEGNALGRNTSYLSNKTPSSDTEMSSTPKARKKKEQQQQQKKKKKKKQKKEKVRRLQVDDNEPAADLSASSRCVSLVSTATNELPSIDELCARVSQTTKPTPGSGGDEQNRSQVSVQQSVADDLESSQPPSGERNEDLPLVTGKADIPSYLANGSSSQTALEREASLELGEPWRMGSSSPTILIRQASLELGEPWERSTNAGGKSQQQEASLHQLAEEVKHLKELVDRLILAQQGEGPTFQAT
jgi:hypothetical protein